MAETRIMHYLNQFFAGVGAEDKTDTPPDFREGALGLGKRLQSLLGDSAKIVVTTYCGDNYFAENTDKALEAILEIAKDHDVEIVVAGPAFAAGRYGFACSEACHFLSASAGLRCLTGMFPENPGVDGYRQYKDKGVFLLPTSDALTGMEEALLRMAKFISKLASGSAIGSAAEEGYLPRGIRLDVDVSKIGAGRAIDMLLDRLAGRSFASEIPYESFEEIPVASPITDIKDACVALASSSGVTAAGNPYGFKMFRNTKFEKYPVSNMNTMKEAGWDILHGGYGTDFMLANPNYGVPLDASRELENEGAFGRLYTYFYGTTGVDGILSDMKNIGRGMVADMKNEGVDAVLLVST